MKNNFDELSTPQLCAHCLEDLNVSSTKCSRCYGVIHLTCIASENLKVVHQHNNFCFMCKKCYEANPPKIDTITHVTAVMPNPMKCPSAEVLIARISAKTIDRPRTSSTSSESDGIIASPSVIHMNYEMDENTLRPKITVEEDTPENALLRFPIEIPTTCVDSNATIEPIMAVVWIPKEHLNENIDKMKDFDPNGPSTSKQALDNLVLDCEPKEAAAENIPAIDPNSLTLSKTEACPEGVLKNKVRKFAQLKKGNLISQNIQMTVKLAIPIPRISIVSEATPSTSRRQILLPSPQRRDHTPAFGVPVFDGNNPRRDLQLCADDIIQRLRIAQQLKSALKNEFRRNIIWSPIRMDFGSCLPDIVWIPVTYSVAKEYSQLVKLYGSTLEQRRIKLRSFRSIMIPVPPFVRRVAKSPSCILWVAISRDVLVNLSLMRAQNSKATDDARKSISTMGTEFAALLAPYLARRINAEVRAGTLNHTWTALLIPECMARLVMDYWQMHQTPQRIQPLYIRRFI